MKPQDLNAAMEFDHPIRVHADGTVTDAGPGIYAPDVYHEELDQWTGAGRYAGTWSLMTGYTGQYGYNGPCMHPSEFIGGHMAEDILATPGIYVVVAVECLDCEECPVSADGEYPEDCEAEHEPAGWAVAYIED